MSFLPYLNNLALDSKLDLASVSFAFAVCSSALVLSNTSFCLFTLSDTLSISSVTALSFSCASFNALVFSSCTFLKSFTLFCNSVRSFCFSARVLSGFSKFLISDFSSSDLAVFSVIVFCVSFTLSLADSTADFLPTTDNSLLANSFSLSTFSLVVLVISPSNFCKVSSVTLSAVFLISANLFAFSVALSTFCVFASTTDLAVSAFCLAVSNSVFAF